MISDGILKNMEDVIFTNRGPERIELNGIIHDVLTIIFYEVVTVLLGFYSIR